MSLDPVSSTTVGQKGGSRRWIWVGALVSIALILHLIAFVIAYAYEGPVVPLRWDGKYAYQAAGQRIADIENAYPKILPGMTVAQVERLLGKPDAAGKQDRHLGDRRPAGLRYQYWLRIVEVGFGNSNDSTVTVDFDTKGLTEASWISNVQGRSGFLFGAPQDVGNLPTTSN